MKIKALICSVLVLAVIAVFASCASEQFDGPGEALTGESDKTNEGSENETAEGVSYADYTYEQAVADGCEVYVLTGDTVSTAELKSEGNKAGFYTALDKNEYASFATVIFTKDMKLLQYVDRISDENGYHVRSFSTEPGKEEDVKYDFAYLSSYTSSNGSKSYIFTNDESVTCEYYWSCVAKGTLTEKIGKNVAYMI